MTARLSPLAPAWRRGGWRGSRRRGGRSTEAWTPQQLSSLRAWYDAEVGQPKYGGAGAYVQLDGTSGDYIYTPDSAATSFNNDIEVVMRVKVTDWSAAAVQTLVGKYLSTGNQRSWRFYSSTAGAIGLSVSPDGTSASLVTVTVTPTVALPDATWIWLRMRLDLTNGSNSVATMETAADTGSNVEPSSWTANGTNTGATISGIFDGTAATEIGTFSNGTTERLTGQVGRCIVRSGFGGTTVADFNASDCYGDGYWHADGYRWNLGLPKIYDRGPNGLAPATFGSGSNQPQWLPWTGVASVHLESASAGTNSISCTAPAGAASYVARHRDYPNVADATGAASAGAFTFTTAGQWQYISILNGSAVEIARFDAALCSQSGMTDSYLVAWTVNRGTSGRKLVVQSPVANSARSDIAIGPDDHINIPVAAIPPSTAADSFSVATTAREWATPQGNQRFFDDNPGAGGGLLIYSNSTTSGINARLGDTVPNLALAAIASTTLGQRLAITAVAEAQEADGLRLYVNQQTATPQSLATIGDRPVAASPAIGKIATGSSGYADIEWEAIAFFDRDLTDIEHGLWAAYYKAGT